MENAQGRGNGGHEFSHEVFSRFGGSDGFMLLFSVHLQSSHISLLVPLKMTLNDSVGVHLRKPMQCPINPLSYFSNLKMIRAWLMTALASLRKLYRRAAKVTPFKGSSLLWSPKPLLPNNLAASLWPL